MNPRASRISLALGFVTAALSSPAHASTIFPEQLRSKLGLSALPYPPNGCQLCHQSDVGGLQTATKPFARSLLKNGAAAGNVPSLFAAVDALDSAGTDSDHDGVGDIAELRAGTDPNVADVDTGELNSGEEVPLPQTGCALGGPPLPAPLASSLFCSALLLLAARRQRRVRQP